MEKNEQVKYLMMGAVLFFALPLFIPGQIANIIFKILMIVCLAAGILVLVAGDKLKNIKFTQTDKNEPVTEEKTKYDNMAVVEIKQKMELEIAKKMAAANEAKAETMLTKAQGDLKKAKVEANRKTDILANLGVDPFATSKTNTENAEDSYEERPRKPKRDMLDNVKELF
jgi:flagellar biosynthesis component FlhA